MNLPPRNITGPTIMLSSGTYFDFLDPVLGSNALHDIAHALSNLCRFTGHARQFYSVAEHSVHVSRLVPPNLALVGLLHDAAEAFVGDMAAPLKALIADYQLIEKRIERVVFAHFGLSQPLPPEVKAADHAMLAAEQAQAMGNADRWHHTHGHRPAPVELQFWTPTEAYAQFIWRFEQLQPIPDRHPATSIGE